MAEQGEKQWVEREYCSVYEYDLLPEVIENFQNILQEGKELGWKDLKLCLAYYDYSDGQHMVITGKRLETDKEMNLRLAQEEKEKATRVMWEQAEYERLKKKFESK